MCGPEFTTPEASYVPIGDQGLWPAMRQFVWRRAHGICEGCAWAGDQVHHRQPRGMGGVHGVAVAVAHSASNLLLLCGPCHRFTEDEPTAAQRLGWLVPHPTDPALVPAYLCTPNGVGWWLLDNNGDYHWVDREGDDHGE